MERCRLKTGPYGIGTMIHSVHITDDVPALKDFYEEVFGGLVYMASMSRTTCRRRIAWPAWY